jgi:hypothetical protein
MVAKESPASVTGRKELDNFSDGVRDLACFLNLVEWHHAYASSCVFLTYYS